MRLHLYRRHSRRCTGGHNPDHQTYESDELRRKIRRCSCPIYASGSLDGISKFRRNTRKNTWPEATAIAESWDADPARCTAVPAVLVPEVLPGEPQTAVMLAVNAYLAFVQAGAVT